MGHGCDRRKCSGGRIEHFSASQNSAGGSPTGDQDSTIANPGAGMILARHSHAAGGREDTGVLVVNFSRGGIAAREQKTRTELGGGVPLARNT